jgi:hypothetical protein
LNPAATEDFDHLWIDIEFMMSIMIVVQFEVVSLSRAAVNRILFGYCRIRIYYFGMRQEFDSMQPGAMRKRSPLEGQGIQLNLVRSYWGFPIKKLECQ